MKKMFIPLIAIVLSVATVSMVDARLTKAAEAAKKKAAPQPVARDMNAATKQLINVEAPKEDRDAALEDLVALFGDNPDELELAKLFILRKQKMNEVEGKKDEIATMKVGWFDFNNVEYNKAKGELATLTAELKTLNDQIRDQSKVVGPEMSRTVKFAIGGAIATAGLLTIDYLFGSPVRNAAMTKGGQLVTDIGAAIEPLTTRISQMYEYGKAKGRAVYEYGKAGAAGLVARVRGTKAAPVMEETPAAPAPAPKSKRLSFEEEAAMP